jgi:transcriptional regulator
MYLPAAFEETRPEVLHALVRDHPLGLLVTQGAQGLQANPLPFLLDTGEDGRPVLRAHVARANPVWRDTPPDAEALVVFQGPQAYITPNWYPSKAENGKQVPTWNYIVVQARGRLVVRDDAAWVRGLVDRLTQRHEATKPKPWAIGDAPPDYIAAMLRAIVGIEIPVEALTGKWKASQNRSAADRAGVVQGLREQADENALALAAVTEKSAKD